MTQEEQERQRLLEEIRRRSEEAELKRIEEEERGAQKRSNPSTEHPRYQGNGFPSVFPSRPMESASAPSRAIVEQRVAALRERFLIALDRGRLDKASEILKELSVLLHGSAELEQYRERLRVAEAEKTRPREKRKSSQAPVDPPAVRQSREDTRRAAELVESANVLYQQEKYDGALRAVDEALTLTPGNDEALRLRDEIQRARKLAESIRQEEAKHRAQEASMRGPVVDLPPQVVDRDPWGTVSGVAPRPDVGFDIMPEEKGPVGPPKPPLLARVATRASRIRIPVKPLLLLSGVALAVVAAYFAIEHIRTAVVPPQYSVLILPADTQSPDSTLVMFAGGMTEELVANLLGIADLRTVNITSTLGLRSPSPVASARSMGAKYVVQWSITPAASGLAVDLSLRDTVDGSALWSMRQEAAIGDVPVLLRDATRGIATAMGLEPSSDEQSVLEQVRPVAPEAYRAYMRGRYLLYHRQEYPVSAAVTAFTRAATLDPKFTAAQSGLGWSCILASEAERKPSSRMLSLAASSIQKALDLGSHSAETYVAWSALSLERAQYEEALQHLEEATSVAPSDAEAQRRLAVLSILRGNNDGALKAARNAVADDPGNVDSYLVLGRVRQYRREYKEAMEAYEQGLSLASDRSAYASGSYGDVLLYLQRHDRAIEVLMDRVARARQDPGTLYKLARVQQSAGRPKQEWSDALLRAKNLLSDRVALDPNDGAAFAQLALVHTRLGEFKEALAASTRALAASPDEPGVLYATARMYALQRDKTRAVEYLTRAVNGRFLLAEVLDMDLFNLQTDAGFQQAVLR